ncbi:MAG: molybdopterin-dependent oxidoreductase [Acetobacteraceae bacterium]|nr:molybdopterin-dependent oxidoreductase [Acetobacteraceae bacterium]
MDGMIETSRRLFLGATGAALLVPVIARAQPAPAPTPPGMGDPGPNRGPGQVVPFIRIAADNSVTLLTPVTEMGQGTHTAHAQIIADELGCAFEAVRVEVGQPALPWRRQPANEQSSGASFGIRFWHDPLRRSAAAAREMLVAAAAQRLGVPMAELAVAEGRVSHAASNRAVTFGEVAEAAAQLPIPAQPVVKPPAERRLTRQPLMRKDIPAKVTGAQRYASDIKLPGMVYAVARLSPVPRAELDGFDRASVASIPGVLDVVPLRRGAAVVATNTWAAIEGAKALSIRFKATPEDGLSTEAMMRTLRQRTRTGEAARYRNEGDINAAAANGARVIEADYEAPYLAHACMETENATARLENGILELWVPTQNQDWALQGAARGAGVDAAHVRVHTTIAGGGFGRRFMGEVSEQVAQCVRHMGRPVKLIWLREDDIGQGWFRPAAAARLRASLDAQGNPTGFNFRTAAQSIFAELRPALMARPGTVDIFAAQSVATDHRYRWGGNIRAEWARVDFQMPVYIWRSVGSSQNGFFVESFVDEVAHATSKDPLEMRRQLLAHDRRALNVVNTVAERAGWGTSLPAGRHRGIAYVESYGSLCAHVAEVSVTGNRVKVHRVVVAIDCGDFVNPNTIAAQMEGSVVMGLSAMMGEKVTLKDGRAEQVNFDAYPVARLSHAPQVETHIIASGEAMGGVGEPGVPPLAPAVCNAIFAATGRRIRSLPLADHGLSF